MERTLTTVRENGQLVLSPEAKIQLGVPNGGEIEVVSGDHSVELRRKREPMSQAEIDRRIAEMQAAFKRLPGEPSLEDELYQMRREEEEHSRRKFGC